MEEPQSHWNKGQLSGASTVCTGLFLKEILKVKMFPKYFQNFTNLRRLLHSNLFSKLSTFFFNPANPLTEQLKKTNKLSVYNVVFWHHCRSVIYQRRDTWHLPYNCTFTFSCLPVALDFHFTFISVNALKIYVSTDQELVYMARQQSPGAQCQ